MDSDIIYVGGGNTENMMEKWREYQVDEYLKMAYEKGVVLSGISAGSICWFIAGHSDSRQNDDADDVHIWVKGLGIIPYFHCPHYNEKGRDTFNDFMIGQKIDGIALEDNVALVFKDGEYSIIKSDESMKAYRFSNDSGSILKNEILK